MKYRVMCKSISYVYLDVEANSVEEAVAIAEDTDGGDFINDGYGDWEYAYTLDQTGNIVD